MDLIPFEDAYNRVMSCPLALGSEPVSLKDAAGRILAVEIKADRDLPPFDRATMDGIALQYASLQNGTNTLRIAGEARAGYPQQELIDPNSCLEVMTGAVVPSGADTVIRYEDLKIESGQVLVTGPVKFGQSIHTKGSDALKGTPLLPSGTRIGPAEIAVLASVGCVSVSACRAPKTVVISTGDELIEISKTPLPHQIRRSNVHALVTELKGLGIEAQMTHLPDSPKEIRHGLRLALESSEVVMLSGGVSMGKYDFLPEILEELGVDKLFHRVAQRPGKPFWFGIHRETGCRVFSFPGNPVSTFLNYHLYFKHWLFKSWNLNIVMQLLPLSASLENKTGLTQFHLGKVLIHKGMLALTPISMNSSGDFVSLSQADGFIRLEAEKTHYETGVLCPFLSYKSIEI